MTLTYIVLATLAGGLLSVLIAASLTVGVLSRLVHNLVSLSAGVLLGTALLHVLPEAFESHVGAHELFLTLLGGPRRLERVGRRQHSQLLRRHHHRRRLPDRPEPGSGDGAGHRRA
jgi:zinc and cadmium transporter